MTSELNARVTILKLVGGRLSLDFANTADWHASERPVEFLTSYDELVAWGAHAGALTERQAARLLEEASRCPDGARAVLERALVLREAIYRIFGAVARGRPAHGADLAILNDELLTAWRHLRLVAGTDGFAWDWACGDGELDQLVWMVVHDAADLLTSAELERVGQCADNRCGWLFLDQSRNRSRRWCSMEECGNRAKARRHYVRSSDSRQ